MCFIKRWYIVNAWRAKLTEHYKLIQIVCGGGEGCSGGPDIYKYVSLYCSIVLRLGNIIKL